MTRDRILVIQTAFLGDLILTLPLVRRLHADHPAAAITLAVRQGLGELVRGQPGVAEVLELRKRRGLARRLGHDRVTLRALREANVDAVYLAHRSFRSGLYAWLTRAPLRIGFARSPSSWACTRRVSGDRTRHAGERYLALAGPHAAGVAVRAPWFEVAPEAREAASRLLRKHGVDPGRAFVTLAPGSVWPTKRWTPEGFSGLSRWLVERDVTAVLVGDSGERALCEEVRSAVGGGVVNLAGKTSLVSLPAILERSSALIGNDSGPGHLAAAVGTPVVSIFGPTTPESGLAPAGDRVLCVGLAELECRPCGRHGARRCPQGHHRCMRDLTPDAVIGRIESWSLNPLRDKPRAPHG